MAIQDNRAIERGDTIEINEGDKEVDIEELIASTKNQTSSKWWKVEQRNKVANATEVTRGISKLG